MKKTLVNIDKAIERKYDTAVHTKFKKIINNVTIYCEQWKFKNGTTKCDIYKITGEYIEDDIALIADDMWIGLKSAEEANEIYKNLVKEVTA